MTSASVHLYPINWDQSHPILTKLGIKFEDLTIQPKNISDLDRMIFFKNEASCGWSIKIIVTREGIVTDNFYVPPNSVENINVDDRIVNVKGIVELNTIFDLQMRAGDILILDDSLRVAEHTNMKTSKSNQSHPILTKLGIKFEDLTIQPKNISDLDRMIFFKNGASAGWGISVWLTREGSPEENFYLMPNSVKNMDIGDATVKVHGSIELNTIFDRRMKAGDVLILDDRLKVVE